MATATADGATVFPGARPLPASTTATAATGGKDLVDLDRVVQLAKDAGIGPRYRINLPREADGVYTISSTSMNGDTVTPGDERTIHIDRNSGKILAEVGFDDYSPLAKSMAVGVAVHQASMGRWNIALNVLACVALIFLCLSGTVQLWLRRPAQSVRLPMAPRIAQLPVRNSLSVLLVLLGLAFPLLGVTLVIALTAYYVSRRIRPGATTVEKL